MPTNDEIKQKLKRENPARVWELDEPALTNALDEARADTAKQIFKELDKILAEDKCEGEHSKCDHDDELDEDNKPDTSCIECACMKYEPYNFNGQLPALKKKYNIEE